MHTYNYEALLLDTLRISMMAIRNLVMSQKRERIFDQMLKEWANFGHSLPTILIGKCDERAVQYFLSGDAFLFERDYPRKTDADYLQVLDIIKDIKQLVVNNK